MITDWKELKVTSDGTAESLKTLIFLKITSTYRGVAQHLQLDDTFCTFYYAAGQRRQEDIPYSAVMVQFIQEIAMSDEVKLNKYKNSSQKMISFIKGEIWTAFQNKEKHTES